MDLLSDGARVFEELDEEECLDLLASGSIGRVAITTGALPAVLPVNYGVADHSVVFRTEGSQALEAAFGQSIVAFETDRFDEEHHTGWSVLVVGMASLITASDELNAAEKLGVEPWIPAEMKRYVKVACTRITGRRIREAVGR